MKPRLAAGRVLHSGARVGPYVVAGILGTGGMGEVYRARDSKLGRDVALKVLCGPTLESLARFRREAQLLASLNHPHIATIYGFEEWDAEFAIAMELVEGPTLAERLANGRLPPQEARRIALQIAEALVAAHARGIVHRDLKPANIKLTQTGEVKVLDFGLAKLSHAVAAASDTTALLSNSSDVRTSEGAIIGTFAYMSPEQAEGKEVDPRSDIFSFGSVLYEMVTGKRPFEGDSPVSTLAAILRDEPQPVRELVPGIGSVWNRTIHSCLAKQPAKRWQSIIDVMLVLEEPDQDTRVLAPERAGNVSMRFAVPAVAVALIGGALLARVFLMPKPANPSPPTYRQLTSDSGLSFEPAISPDGKLLAYSSDRAGEGSMDIWVRQLPNGHPVRIASGEADDREPSFSPGGEKIVFRSDRDGGGIYVVSSLGGDVRRIAEKGRFPRYSPDGRWISYWIGEHHPSITGQVWVVPATGGEPRQLTSASLAEEPVWTPDSSGVIANGTTGDWRGWLYLPVAGSEWRRVISREELLAFDLSPPPEQNYMRPAFYAKDGIAFSAHSRGATSLWHLPVSQTHTAAGGQPVQLTAGPGDHQHASVTSGTSTPRYVFASLTMRSFIASVPATPASHPPAPRRWTSGEDINSDGSVSPDGVRLAYISNRSGSRDVWLKDLKSGRETALTETPWAEGYARLSPDGSNVMFIVWEPPERKGLWLVNVTTGSLRRLCESCRGSLFGGWVGDNQFAYNSEGGGIGLLRVASNDPIQLINADVLEPRGSPDAKWLAFHTFGGLDIRQVFVAPLGTIPIPRAEWIPITDDKGLNRNAAWAPDGSRLYYVSDRDGFRCIWATNLDAATKRPIGEAFAVYHAHNTRFALMNFVAMGRISLSATKNEVFYSQPELTGNIWMVETATATK